MTIYAKLTHPENGYDSDRARVSVLDTLGTYKLRDASVGQSHTNIYLEGFKNSFNSVQFDFYDEYGNEVNIFRMPEFNPYIRRTKE